MLPLSLSCLPRLSAAGKAFLTRQSALTLNRSLPRVAICGKEGSASLSFISRTYHFPLFFIRTWIWTTPPPLPPTYTRRSLASRYWQIHSLSSSHSIIYYSKIRSVCFLLLFFIYFLKVTVVGQVTFTPRPPGPTTIQHLEVFIIVHFIKGLFWLAQHAI